jgi:hypothetical protein
LQKIIFIFYYAQVLSGINMYICIFFNNQTGNYIIQVTQNPIKALAKLLGDSGEHTGGESSQKIKYLLYYQKMIWI